ncbi:127_t:CDS:1 [Funneliformis mosseae]|uniref:127_t:CDS:1 n=1 Tax=Funneliformis mosseae TaxID=27381 RepID=A0A9N9ENU1_FUNMO|nr:127_t:CDS:1 [Funneliformis mosseae]
MYLKNQSSAHKRNKGEIFCGDKNPQQVYSIPKLKPYLYMTSIIFDTREDNGSRKVEIYEAIEERERKKNLTFQFNIQNEVGNETMELSRKKVEIYEAIGKREREKNPFRFKIQNEVGEKKLKYMKLSRRERKKKKPFEPEDNGSRKEDG